MEMLKDKDETKTYLSVSTNFQDIIKVYGDCDLMRTASQNAKRQQRKKKSSDDQPDILLKSLSRDFGPR